MGNQFVFLFFFTACLSASTFDKCNAQEYYADISLDNQAARRAATIFVDQPLSATFIEALSRSLEDAGYEDIQIEAARHSNMMFRERTPKLINFRIHLAHGKLTLTFAPLQGRDLIGAIAGSFSEDFTIASVRLKDFPTAGQRFNTLELLKNRM